MVSYRAVKQEDGSVSEMLITVKNVHDLKETEQALSSVNKHFDAMQELSDDLLFRIDLNSKVINLHGKKKNTFGLYGEYHKFPDDVYQGGAIHPEDVKIYQEFADLALAGKEGTVEVRMRERENESFGFRRISWIPVLSESGEVTEITGKQVDVQMVKELQEQANFDALTKLLNKRAMLECTSTIINNSNQSNIHALFFMDLDNFKYVNDNLGHSFGDFLLSELGKRLSESVRSQDLVGRVGGDEFVLFLRDIPNESVLLGKAKMILSTISEDFYDGNQRHNIHGSLGISVYPDHGKTYEELYHHADLALYQSKNQGKNTVTMYSDMNQV